MGIRKRFAFLVVAVGGVTAFLMRRRRHPKKQEVEETEGETDGSERPADDQEPSVFP